ncbi:MAG TPA: thiamine phosphate synthase [Planctomycetaceae bacterium]|nr:thiamine phosphate synthase [Planctomycetaceae bacterium]
MLTLDEGNVGQWLREHGLDPTDLFDRVGKLHSGRSAVDSAYHGDSQREGEYGRPVNLDIPLDTPLDITPDSPLDNPLDNQGEKNVVAAKKPAVHTGAVPRLLDAAGNRAGEALRVVEDYVRFLRDDAVLTRASKAFRHELGDLLKQLPQRERFAFRETENDVGTEIEAAGEYERSGIDEVLAANFSRLQESLRSLEEFSKIAYPHLARSFERLRYRCYTLQKEIAGFPEHNRADHCETAGRTTDLQVKNETRAHRTFGSDSAQSPRKPGPPGGATDSLRSIFNLETKKRLRESRLYVLIDAKDTEDTFAEIVRELIGAGVDVLQLRDKSRDDRTLLRRGRTLRELTVDTGTLFIMNDRPDLAIACEADGVHVGQEELDVRDVRAIVGPERLIGVSTHSLEQARKAIRDGADYIGVGPVFPSSTKEFGAFVGTELLRQVAAIDPEIPAFAIGGIDEARLLEIIGAGFHRIAVGAAVLAAKEPGNVVKKMKTGLTGTELSDGGLGDGG